MKDLGFAELIVGRHAFDIASPRTVPAVGDESGPDYELLLTLRPTHVLLQLGQREIPSRLAALASERGWLLRDYPLLTLADIRTLATDLDRTFRPDQTGPPPPLLARLDASLAHRPGLDRAGRVLLLANASPPGVLGPGSFHVQMLESIGGTSAVREGGPWLRLDAEDVLAIAPDGIIFFDPPEGDAASTPAAQPDVNAALARLGRVGTLDIPAIRSRHVAVIVDPQCLTPSSAMMRTADEMATILRRWADEP
jgi:ABC-type Fe3+-hydroxamate transport system substrate-binding protein